MEQLLIAKNILQHRQQAEVTQEQLAHILGVTKAAVSKWETGQSLPDILILPKLATYFNVTIDDLLGYSRQLNHQQIQNVYKALAEQFATGEIDEALNKSSHYVKEYYHCYPLIVKICGLYLNHLELIVDVDVKQKVLKDIIHLCNHVTKHCDKLSLLQEAKLLLSLTYLFNQQPQLALEHIGEEQTLIIPETSLRAQCYATLGKEAQAQKTLQVGLYQTTLNLMQMLIDYLSLQFNNKEQFEETYKRACAVSDAFNLAKLHPTTHVRLHYVGALGYAQFQQHDIALSLLKRYVKDIKENLFPLQLKGDAYFTQITSWFEEVNISLDPPRDPSVVKQSLIQSLLHPAFQALHSYADFTQLQHDLNKLSIV